MQYLLVILLIALSVSQSETLVHFMKLTKGEDGCLTSTMQQLKVGEFIQDEKTCGAIQCINRDGDALVLYCQIPLPFAECEEDYVNKAEPFPKCCWTCVKVIHCG